jgi:hypothetical protein
MADVTGSKGGFNFLHHFSVDASLGIPPTTFVDAHGVTIGIIQEPVMIDIRNVSGLGLVPDPADVHVQEWAYDAYNAFNQQIPTKVSLANFLYELKDIKGMIPKIEHSFVRTESFNFLGFEFGVILFISDVKNIWALADSVQKRIEFLKQTVGEPRKVSFVRDIPPQGDTWQITLPFGGSFEGPSYIVKRLSYQGKFHIGAQFIQNLDIPDTSLATAKAFAAAAGFNNPAAIVWEAIPYSFVVDWFFHVDSMVGTLNIQPFEGRWEVSNVGYSIKDEFQYYVYLDTGSNDGHRQIPVGTISVKRFVRKPGFPMSSLLLTDGSLSTTQQVLALALLEQRR